MKSAPGTWGWISISLHWLVAIAVFCLFGLGLWMVDLTYYDAWYQSAPHVHKSIGVLLFFTMLFRLVWRQYRGTPPPLENHTWVERKLASIAHGALYLLLFAIMFSGYLISTADGRSIEVFNWFEVPALFSGFDNQEDLAGKIHLALAIVMISLAGLHATGALKHHFIDKDRTLKRMIGL